MTYMVTINRVIHRNCGQVFISLCAFAFAGAILAGCANSPPKNLDNVCSIFNEKGGWHQAAKAAQKKWGTPLHVSMAIIYQESKFLDDAKPPRKQLLGVIPWRRASTAYGYSQAKTGTWKDYIRDTGNRGADRDRFEDAVDFISWYVFKTHQQNNISKWDAHNQYLNYHEGWGGYRKGTHKGKSWLLSVADSVNSRAGRYATQYGKCKNSLKSGGWFS